MQALIEQRWTAVPEEQYEHERKVIGTPVELVADGVLGLRAKLPNATTGSGEAAALLDDIKRSDPAEPFWRGVSAMESQPDGVELAFNHPVDPQLLANGSVQVACHLHDPRFSPSDDPL